MKNKRAFLIIDMQKGSFTSKTPRFDTEGVVKRMNELSDLFRKSELPVIYIQHDGAGTGEFEKNTSEWELLDSLNVESTDILIDICK
ncbi:MAG: isochorismatase family protein [Flavobacteriales bacterium]|nr:isochorismatase family protein [Flavobacteriales bacterium]